MAVAVLPLHDPLQLAEAYAMADVISNGRLDFGIGKGSEPVEYRKFGLNRDEANQRFGEEAEIIRQAWSDGPVNFHGEFYRVEGVDILPKPVQRPHPPFLIGGGQRRILSFAAREAQIVGLAPTAGPPAADRPKRFTRASVEQQVAWVREAAGDRFDDLTLNIYPSSWPVAVTDDARAEARRAADALRERGVDLTEDEVLASPYLFIGSVDSLVEKFIGLREDLGISSILAGELDEMLPVVERLAGT